MDVALLTYMFSEGLLLDAGSAALASDIIEAATREATTAASMQADVLAAAAQKATSKLYLGVAIGVSNLLALSVGAWFILRDRISWPKNSDGKERSDANADESMDEAMAPMQIIAPPAVSLPEEELQPFDELERELEDEYDAQLQPESELEPEEFDDIEEASDDEVSEANGTIELDGDVDILTGDENSQDAEVIHITNDIGEQMAGAITGMIEDLSIPDLLQLFSTSRKSGVLIVHGEQDRGNIYLRQGRIFYALLEDEPNSTSHKAFYRLMRCQKGKFSFEHPDGETFPDEIDESIEALMMEGMRQYDEIQHLGDNVPSLHDQIIINKPLKAPLQNLSAELLETFQLVFNYERVSTILTESPHDDPATLKNLLSLIDHKYVDVIVADVLDESIDEADNAAAEKNAENDVEEMATAE